MNVLVLGSGGREHALCWKIAQSPLLEKLYVAPGNPGMEAHAQTVALSLTDFKGIMTFCSEKKIALVVVGPEQPLADGITDYFKEHFPLNNIIVFGPSKAAAQLESSKDFAKQFMLRNGIPTAKALAVEKGSITAGFDFLAKQQPPYVLKADGLAAGKGVVIVQEEKQAKKVLQEMLSGQFGAASEKVLLEEFLTGIELSVFVLTNGKEYILLPEAKDYKRIGEGDTGANTGGMGAISPVPFADEAFMRKVRNKVIAPTIKNLEKEGIEYLGFIFFGLIKVGNEPYVIEYNVRMGDPETQAVLPRFKSDLLEAIVRVGENRAEGFNASISEEVAATVILVSGGYPEQYEKGKTIEGLQKNTESLIFHAGTKQGQKGEIITNGGRVLAITSLEVNKEKALEKSYRTVGQLTFEGMYFRNDIGFDL